MCYKLSNTDIRQICRPLWTKFVVILIQGHINFQIQYIFQLQNIVWTIKHPVHRDHDRSTVVWKPSLDNRVLAQRGGGGAQRSFPSFRQDPMPWTKWPRPCGSLQSTVYFHFGGTNTSIYVRFQLEITMNFTENLKKISVKRMFL